MLVMVMVRVMWSDIWTGFRNQKFPEPVFVSFDLLEVVDYRSSCADGAMEVVCDIDMS